MLFAIVAYELTPALCCPRIIPLTHQNHSGLPIGPHPALFQQLDLIID